MKDNNGVPFIGVLPKNYDPIILGQMFRQLELYLKKIQEPGPVRVSTINVSSLPTSTTGLRSGDLWNDTGTVKVVP